MTHFHMTCLIHMWHDAFLLEMNHVYVIRLNHMWRDSFTCDRTHSHVTWLSHMTWLIRMWHDSYICGMTHSYDTTHSNVTWVTHMWHASFIRPGCMRRIGSQKNSYMTASPENELSLISTKSSNSDSFISRGTNLTQEFGPIWICTRILEFLDLADWGKGSFSVETVIWGGYA